MDFPRNVYKVPGPFQRQNGTFDMLTVETQDAHDEALSKGWHGSMPDAIEAAASVHVASETQRPDNDDANDVGVTAEPKRRGRPPKVI